MKHTTSNKNARELVQARKPFKGSHTFGEWRGTLFGVYSYGYHFPLFVFDSIEKKWYANADKYSPTTSKHYGQLHPLVDSTKLHTVELKQMLANA